VIQADLGNLIVKRTITRGKAGGKYTTKLTVEAANGGKYSKPQEAIDGFMGALSMDPVAFMSAEPKKQFDMLRRFVPGVDFEAIDAANKADFDKRTEVNREIKQRQNAAAAIVVPDDLPAEPIDEAALLERMTNAAQVNAGIEQDRAGRLRAAETRDHLLDKAKEMRLRAEGLRRQAEEADKEASECQDRAATMSSQLIALPPLPPLEDVTELRLEVNRAREVNAQIARRAERDRLLAEASQKEWDAEAYTDAIEARTKEKQEAIAAAVMPVEGLGFGDQVVLFNGHPIKQASGAQQLRISVAIAMAANPELRVIRIRDGNSLDPDNLQLLREMAAEKDFQVWIERVETSGKVGFVIEDGRVVASPSQGDLLGEAA
jgi:hypothetical protein